MKYAPVPRAILRARAGPIIPVIRRFPAGELDVVRRSPVEQRGKALVQFGADEGEPVLQPVTIDSARCRSEPARGLRIRQILHDRRTLGEDAPVVEAQGGDVALRIHRHLIQSGCCFLLGEVHLFQFELFEIPGVQAQPRPPQAAALRLV